VWQGDEEHDHYRRGYGDDYGAMGPGAKLASEFPAPLSLNGNHGL
jgi:hypothetical protein